MRICKAMQWTLTQFVTYEMFAISSNTQTVSIMRPETMDVLYAVVFNHTVNCFRNQD